MTEAIRSRRIKKDKKQIPRQQEGRQKQAFYAYWYRYFTFNFRVGCRMSISIF